MPTYEYKCNACGHRFDQFQSMMDKALKKCPECGKNALERLIGTGAAVLFKGSGFYQTDYRSESYRKAAAAESKGGAEKNGSADAGKAAEKPSPAKSEGVPAKRDGAPGKSEKPAKKKES